MDEQDHSDFLSHRDLSAIEMGICVARRKEEAAKVMQAFDLSEEVFAERFPDLAKMIRNLPD